MDWSVLIGAAVIVYAAAVLVRHIRAARRGVARALFGEAARRVQEKGGERLNLTVCPCNQKALAFYARRGMSPRRFVPEMLLSSKPPRRPSPFAAGLAPRIRIYKAKVTAKNRCVPSRPFS